MTVLMQKQIEPGQTEKKVLPTGWIEKETGLKTDWTVKVIESIENWIAPGTERTKKLIGVRIVKPNVRMGEVSTITETVLTRMVKTSIAKTEMGEIIVPPIVIALLVDVKEYGIRGGFGHLFFHKLVY